MNLSPERLESVSGGLSPRGREFLKRVYSGGLANFDIRLRALGFDALDRVLDAGCGFGQWSLAMAEQGVRVSGIDVDADRIHVAAKLAEDVSDCDFRVGGIEELPYADASFDGVFCYSAIYYTDVKKTLAEFFRVLKPGGYLYICSNGFGWALYNLLKCPNPTPDFNPRTYALNTLRDSVRYALRGMPPSPEGSVLTSIAGLSREIERLGGRVLASGGDGSIHHVKTAAPQKSFFRGRYLGFEAVSEWLAQKGES